MKSVIWSTVFTALMLVGGQAKADDMTNKSPQEKQQYIDDKLRKMDQRLNLTDDQEMQIRQILQRKADGELEKDQAHQQIDNILTPEQRPEHQKMMQEKKSEKKNR